VAAVVVTVMVELPVPGTDVGANVAVAPAGSPLALKTTVSVKPPLGVMVAVYEVLLPAATVCEAGDAVIVKSPTTGAFTTRLTDAVCVSVPSVPLIVNG
jgi:hypothetical protein